MPVEERTMTMTNRIFSFAILLLLTGCVERNVPQEEIQKVSFSISPITVADSDDMIGTKTGIVENGNTFDFVWASNDTVGIYPDRGSQVYFEISSGSGSSHAVFDGGGWSFKASANYYSYYPFYGDIYLERSAIPVQFTGQRQPVKASTDHIGVADFAYTAATSATSGSLNFQYQHLSCFVRVRLMGLPAGTYTKLTVKSSSAVLTEKGHYDLLSATPSIIADKFTDAISIDLDAFEISEGEEVKVYLALAPVNLQGQSVIVSVLDSERKEYQCVKTPSTPYEAGQLYGLKCPSTGDTWTEVPQSVGFSVQDWDAGSNIGGTAE